MIRLRNRTSTGQTPDTETDTETDAADSAPLVPVAESAPTSKGRLDQPANAAPTSEGPMGEKTFGQAATTEDGTEDRAGRRFSRARFLGFVVLPVAALVLAIGASYLKYTDDALRSADVARTQSVQVASDGAVALLSYTPDTVEAKLGAARDLLTGTFRDSYTSLTHDVVIPGSKQKLIAATATVPAASSVSASENHAVVLVFIDQSIVIGGGAPTNSVSAVEVTLDKVGNRWLISNFEPK